MKQRIIHIIVILVILSSCKKDKTINDEYPQTVPFESIRNFGELNERILRNFDRMETELYQPDQVFWSEEESGGWPGDKEGRTILALTLLQRTSGRKAQYLEEIISRLPHELNERGYLGSIHDGIDEQQLSGHGWLLRGLCEYYEMTGDTTALNIAGKVSQNLFLPIKYHLQDYPINPDSRIKDEGDMSGSLQNTVNGWHLSSDIGCLFIGMDGLIHYYSLNPNPGLKDLIEDMINLFLKIDLKGIKAQTHASLTALRGIMRFMKATEDYTLLPDVEKRWQLYIENGMTENFENFNWFDRYDTWTEPCAIIDSYMLAVQLWQATGNLAYLDEADEIYYNGICHTQRVNGGFGCDKPVGPDFDDISIHADEAHWCCTMRGGEGLSRVAQYSYFLKNDTILIPFFRDNELKPKEPDINIVQRTDYPFGNNVSLHAFGKDIESHCVGMRIPGHVKFVSAYLGDDQEIRNLEENMIYIEGKDLKDNFLNICYELKRDTIRCIDEKRYKIQKGPLVVSLDESTSDTLPLYHLLNPEVSLSNQYKRKVLFPVTN